MTFVYCGKCGHQISVKGVDLSRCLKCGLLLNANEINQQPAHPVDDWYLDDEPAERGWMFSLFGFGMMPWIIGAIVVALITLWLGSANGMDTCQQVSSYQTCAYTLRAF